MRRKKKLVFEGNCCFLLLVWLGNFELLVMFPDHRCCFCCCYFYFFDDDEKMTSFLLLLDFHLHRHLDLPSEQVEVLE